MGDKRSNTTDVANIIKKIKVNQKSEADPKEEIITDEEDNSDVMRGRPKSGRIWKSKKERFVVIGAVFCSKNIILILPILINSRFNVVKKSLKKKSVSNHLKFRDEIKHVKELSRSIITERKKQNEEYRVRREENLRRRLENERKNEIVQVIKNTAKMKRMSKKQLRKVEKRDTTKVNVK
jgi:rRNA-processing protein CGR1